MPQKRALPNLLRLFCCIFKLVNIWIQYLNLISKDFYISEKNKLEYFFTGFSSFLRIYSSEHLKQHFLFNTFSSILLKSVCFGNNVKDVSWICSSHLVLATASFPCSLYTAEHKSNAWWFWLTSDDKYESNQQWFWLTSGFLSGCSAFIFRFNRCYCKNIFCLHKNSEVIFPMT